MYIVQCVTCDQWPAEHPIGQPSDPMTEADPSRLFYPDFLLLVLKIYFLPLLHDYHILSTRILMGLSIVRQLVFNRTDREDWGNKRWKVFFQKILTKYGTEVQDHISNLTDRHSSGLRPRVYLYLVGLTQRRQLLSVRQTENKVEMHILVLVYPHSLIGVSI